MEKPIAFFHDIQPMENFPAIPTVRDIMETKHLNSWHEFKAELAKLESYRNSLSQEPERDIQPLLFRGQQNACWSLNTTLERHTTKEQTHVLEYYEAANEILPLIKSCCGKGKEWSIDFEAVREWVKELKSPFLYSLPYREYMTYLRHYGFPSPLLDWTKNPYIAAYFAFRSVLDKPKRVSIYAYIEYIGIGKTIEGNGPIIATVPENELFDKRHSLQQSSYTTCIEDTSSEITFSSHEKAFPKSDSDENLLWKFTLPSSDRLAVLAELDKMDIHSYKLFDTEESLMETLKVRVFNLKNGGL